MTYDQAIENTMPEVQGGSSEPFIVYRDRNKEWHVAHTHGKDGAGHFRLRHAKAYDPLALQLQGRDFRNGSYQSVFDSILCGRAREQWKKFKGIRQHEAQIHENERKLDKSRGFKSSLYESMMDGKISKDDYGELKAKYNKEEADLADAIVVLREKIEGAMAGDVERLRWMEHFKRFEGLAEIDRRIVISMIKNIKISRNGEIAITFNYNDEYKEALAVAKLSGYGAALKEVA